MELDEKEGVGYHRPGNRQGQDPRQRRANMGSLYRRGKIWWLQTYQAGRAVRECTGTSDKAEARRLLKEREGQIAKGEAIPKLGKTTWDEASTDLRGYYQAYGT
jgi:hypothetical protein